MNTQSKLTLALIIVAGLYLAFGVYSYFDESKSKEIVLNPIQRLRVPANIMWFDTGIDVTGKSIRIEYDSGEWRNHPTSEVNAGIGLGPYSDQSALILPSAPLSSLIGKTRGSMFYVGNKYEGSPGAGNLYLSINDKEGTFDDNLGALYVVVTLVKSEPTLANTSETFKIPNAPAGKAFSVIDPSITINPDGSWTVVVPPISKGVPLIVSDGREFLVSAGDTIEITATGQVDIGRGPVGPSGEVGYRDTYVDSQFNDKVGGLEMWIGPEKRLNRYFIGPHFVQQIRHSGIPTLRVIETMTGYGDGNSGAFTVVFRKQ